MKTLCLAHEIEKYGRGNEGWLRYGLPAWRCGGQKP